jgi:hypothetical protein
VVLSWARALVLGGLVAGCGESLFDARPPQDEGRDAGGDRDGGDADAAADFDGTLDGRNAHWRYLDDIGNRQWTAMMVDGMQMVGNASRNRIATCAASPGKPACDALPRALLMTSAGAAGGAGTAGGSDPAIEFTTPSTQGLELRVRAFVPDGDSQQIRLYRNSREDVLFTAVAAPGTLLDQMVRLDALAGDRFLVAIAAGPSGGAATDLALHLTISSTNTAFPSTCQLALAFESQTGNNVVELCRGAVYGLRRVPGGTQAPLTRSAGPYFEHGSAAQITDGTQLTEITGDKLLDHSAGITIQFWMLLDVPVGVEPVWPFADHDPEFGSGLGVSLQAIGPVPPALDVMGFADGAFVHAAANLPDVLRWHFIRIVHTQAEIALCIDGVRAAQVATTNAAFPTVNAPVLGSEPFASVARFDGALDDVRAITGALPCE